MPIGLFGGIIYQWLIDSTSVDVVFQALLRLSDMGKRMMPIDKLGQLFKYIVSGFMPGQKSFGLLVMLLSASLFIAAPGVCLAASGLDILDRQRDQTPPTPRSQPRIEITEDGELSGADAGAQFVLRSLRLDGSTVFSPEELLEPYRGFVGKPITFARLYSMAAELTRKYRDAGYLLSRVIIPEQQVEQAGADIRLLAVEGFIEAIEYTGDERILERFKNYFAPAEEKIVGRKPLKHSMFERYILLMQDVPGIEIASRFQKGTLPGASVLVLEVQGDYVEGSLGWGNTGTDSSGPGIASAGLSVNTLPVIGAQTTLGYAQANDYREYLSAQIGQSYRMWNGLEFNASYAYSDSPEMDTEFARNFDYTTESHTFSLGVAYPFIRSRDLNLSAGLNYEHRNSDADIDGSRFTKDRLRTLGVTVDFDFSDSLGGVTQVIPTLSRGLDVFDATDEASDASNALAPADFWRFGLYASRNQQLPSRFSLFTAGEVQFSDASLASYNKFFLGGSRFGRGYDPGVIEGDNGVAVSAEPRWTHYLTDTTGLQLFAFIDWGRAWDKRNVWGVPHSQTASSFGGGVRLWGHVGNEALPDFNISAFVGQPMERAGDDDGDSPRFVVQFGLLF